MAKNFNLRQTAKHCIVAIICTISFQISASTTIHYFPAEEPKDKYPLELVQFLLSKLDKEYNYNAIEFQQMSVNRQISELDSGHISFASFATNEELEQNLRPIRIPILKGLLGHRVFIIRDTDQNRFAKITSLTDLQNLRAGQGRFWADTPVLKNAGIPTVDPVKYFSLFHMLEGGRFDFFPRAVHEPFSEIATRPELNLAVENNLMLVYPLPMYLYTSKNNEGLAQDIETAFEMAIADGSFDQWFKAHPLILDALGRVNVAKRTVLRIDNPYLPKQTPLDRKELWLDVRSL
ncbi:diguanylate cyclase [Echinimonas agarilytica]|uniref:Diguanylate cyclase n=1 Tax=Echinimonas agarilytica TaxID=1215918 RepID=A0AA42B659_9GAMM|nr:diguanylate cyclase [Echinimonas agarilytica]MCM2678412.1 diguanylate cyclase [Echinimonas agarilytica]